MFARRHPFLFFSLVLTTIASVSFLGLTGMILGASVLFQKALPLNLESSGGNVGIVEISGVISSSKVIVQQIRDFREKEGIKAIVVRVESPGGGVAPSQEIYREIIKARQQKTVIASLGSVAASGGYYAAAAADGIMANPGTITGSIGVIMELANIQELMKKIGIDPIVIKSGQYKDIGSPVKKLSEKERKILQDVADEIHGQFISDVAMQRNIEESSVRKLADGRIYTGERAMTLSLVDRLGNLDDAVNWAGELAGIQDDVVPVYPEEDKVMAIRKLVQSVLKDADIAGAVSDYFRFVVN